MKKIANNRVGIDLDNTIISYDKAFQINAITHGLVDKNCQLNKKDLRDLIRRQTDGEFQWQKLQGFVYGQGIKEANIFPGVYRFLWRCKERNIDVEIVSHKTEYGHYDTKKISLRDSANKFLVDCGLLAGPNQLINKVTYLNTKQEKIEYIKQNNYEFFIDDLEEIILSEDLSSQKGILFSSDCPAINNSNKFYAKSWEDISQIILGDWSLEQVKKMANSFSNISKINSVEKIVGRGNSSIYKLNLNNTKKAALKVYPEISSHDRLESEYLSTKIFKELNIRNVQRPISFDSNLGIGIYEWIEGERVKHYGVHELKAALSFLRILHENSKMKQFENFAMAADSCPRGRDIELQINRRLHQFDELSPKHSELHQFLKDDFRPFLKEVISWSKAIWPSDYSYENSIEKNDLILSPSDFGFHNAIRIQNNNLIFHDFEYFGWDDPIKLISDFSHHAAMNLSTELEKIWFSETSEIYGKHLLERLIAAWPMYGLNWCLIILNEFKEDVWSRRHAADSRKTNLREENLAIQLDKSKAKLNSLAKTYKNKFYW